MKKVSILALAMFLSLVSCSTSENDNSTQPDPDPGVEEQQSVAISATKATTDEGTFEEGAAVGLYMIDSGTTLLSSGNYVNNMKLTYGSYVWTPSEEFYWKSNTSQSDFIAYFPYSSISDATNYELAVYADQSSLSNYNASDFLLGYKLNQSYTTSTVNLTLDHIMSKLVIYLAAGDGFTEDEIKAATVSVLINNVATSLSVNLANSELTINSDVQSVTPYNASDLCYKAIIVPQVVAETNLITVNIDGSSYNLNRSMTFESNKEYTSTITLSKTEGGINVGIGSWDVVDGDFGGTVN